MPLVPQSICARGGGVRVRFGAPRRSDTGDWSARESGGYRVRFPRIADTCEAVLINTGGGMAGGDRMTVEIALDRGASAIVTTQAAEKIYRSQGALDRDRYRSATRAVQPACLAAAGDDPVLRQSLAAQT